MALPIYDSVEDMMTDLSEGEILAKVNQFHKERNARMEHNKDYQARKREEIKYLRSKLAEMERDRTVFVGKAERQA